MDKIKKTDILFYIVNKVSKAGIYLSDKITVFARDFIKFVGSVFSAIFGE